MITIFRLIGTKFEAECHPNQQEVIIWEGTEVRVLLSGGTANECLEKAKAWFRKHVDGYRDEDIVRIK